jgi:hypothetical protein
LELCISKEYVMTFAFLACDKPYEESYMKLTFIFSDCEDIIPSVQTEDKEKEK